LPKSSNDDPIYDVQSTVVASLHLLDAMRAQQSGRIVFISSGGTVYGAPKYLPVDERHPTEPEVSYGITKLAIEKYLLMYGRLFGIRPVILRVANPFGARQRVETAQGAVAVFLRRAMRGLPIDIWGDGSVTRDFIYISDVADAFAKALDYAGDQAVFNISSGVGTSLNELIALLEDVLGVSVTRRYLNGRPFDVPVNVLANDLARRALGWEPRVAMREGLARTVAWMREPGAEHRARRLRWAGASSACHEGPTRSPPVFPDFSAGTEVPTRFSGARARHLVRASSQASAPPALR
jgi:UDP-glucose 4-epimerase